MFKKFGNSLKDFASYAFNQSKEIITNIVEEAPGKVSDAVKFAKETALEIKEKRMIYVKKKFGMAEGYYKDAVGYTMGEWKGGINNIKAMEQFKRAADKGYPSAFRSLAARAKDEKEAYDLYLQGARAGDTLSYYILAQGLKNNRWMQEKSKEEIKRVRLDFLKKAAKNWKENDALVELANIYMKEGTEEEKKAAKFYYYISAAQGNKEAYDWIKKNKMSMNVNLEKFSAWKEWGLALFNKITSNDSEDQQYEECVRYAIGLGLDQNDIEANHCFQRLAIGELIYGHTKAQVAIAKKLFYGIGIKQNFTESLKYFKMAASDGDPEALFYLGTIARDWGDLKFCIHLQYSAKQYFEWSKCQGSVKGEVEYTKIITNEQYKDNQTAENNSSDLICKDVFKGLELNDYEKFKVRLDEINMSLENLKNGKNKPEGISKDVTLLHAVYSQPSFTNPDQMTTNSAINMSRNLP